MNVAFGKPVISACVIEDLGLKPMAIHVSSIALLAMLNDHCYNIVPVFIKRGTLALLLLFETLA